MIERYDWQYQKLGAAIVGTDLGQGVDMTDVGADAGGAHHVVQPQLPHRRVQLQQQRQRLRGELATSSVRDHPRMQARCSSGAWRTGTSLISHNAAT